MCSSSFLSLGRAAVAEEGLVRFLGVDGDGDVLLRIGGQAAAVLVVVLVASIGWLQYQMPR